MVVAAGERAGEIPAANARLAQAARHRGIALASHDDETPAMRAAYRALGCEICEFPKTSATAAAARENGEASVLGAPNVVRGGSQSGGIDAADAIRDGLCDVLTSDYYYPSMMQAALRLVAAGSATIADAWSLVASAPAIAARLVDRGRLAPGLRADIVVVDDRDPKLPRAVAVIVGGRLTMLDASAVSRPLGARG
jgi:alpha-D-ribose 1-methylphosphonate 5-triphosphate diphosphatase